MAFTRSIEVSAFDLETDSLVATEVVEDTPERPWWTSYGASGSPLERFLTISGPGSNARAPEFPVRFSWREINL